MIYKIQDKNIELTLILHFHAKRGSLVRKPRHQITQLQIFLHKHLEDNFLGFLGIFPIFPVTHAPSRTTQRSPTRLRVSFMRRSSSPAPAHRRSEMATPLEPSPPVDHDATDLRPKGAPEVPQLEPRRLGQAVRPIFRRSFK